MNPINGATPVPGPTIMTGTCGSLGSRKKRFVRKKMGIWKEKKANEMLDEPAHAVAACLSCGPSLNFPIPQVSEVSKKV
jgi:hypothetical protein